MANKRIRDLSERTTFSSGDYLATDNSSGTRKVDASKILTPISTAQSTADLVTSRVSNSGDAFSSTKGYDVGDLVVAPTDNLIYRCKTAYSTGASWNSRKANFEQISVVKAVDTLNAALSNKQNKTWETIKNGSVPSTGGTVTGITIDSSKYSEVLLAINVVSYYGNQAISPIDNAISCYVGSPGTAAYIAAKLTYNGNNDYTLAIPGGIRGNSAATDGNYIVMAR